MFLQQACEQMISERDIDAETTAAQYLRAVTRFSEFLGRMAKSEDLTYANVNSWLPWLAANYGASATTQRNYRRAICVPWNYLSSLDLSDGYNVRRLRQPKAQLQPPRAWSPSNVAALLFACNDFPGSLRNGQPAAKVLRAWILTEHCTGLRPSDMRALNWSDIDLARRLIPIVQSKTGHAHTAQLSVEAVNALLAIRIEGVDRVFSTGKGGMRRWELRLFKHAEQYGFVRQRRQALGTLRKSHATEVCRLHGLNAAAESLGHVSGAAIARAHYVEPSAMRPGSLPPPLPLLS